MNKLLQIFVSFFRIGLFTFGGGYTMIVMMQREVTENRKWATKDEFLSYLSLAQTFPGPMAVNTSVLIGYKEKKLRGALCGFFGSVLPSFIILLIVAIFFRNIYNEPAVVKIFMGIRPAVVALILYPVFTFAKNVTRWEYPLFIAVALAIFFGISPLYTILGAIIFGIYKTIYGEF